MKDECKYCKVGGFYLDLSKPVLDAEGKPTGYYWAQHPYMNCLNSIPGYQDRSCNPLRTGDILYT